MRNSVRLSLVLLVFIVFYAKAGDSLSPALLNTIEKGLATSGISTSDIWLPWDFHEDDDNRLNLIKSFFNEPLKAASFTRYNGEQLSGPFLRNFESYFSRVFTALDMKELQLYSYDNVVPAFKVNEFLNTKTDSIMGFVGATLLRQYVQPFIYINNEIQKDILVSKSHRLSYLMLNAGHFLMPAAESQDANVFELKAEEDSTMAKAEAFFQYGKSVKQSELLNHGLSLYNHLLKLANIAKGNIKLYQDSVRMVVIDTKYGRIAIGGKNDNIYNGEYVMIIDVGGNDKYILPSFTLAQSAQRRVCYIVDMEGSDTYIGGDYSFGGAAFGMSVLIDIEGNDNYLCGNFSLGSGLFGVGIVHDMAGNDNYVSKSNSCGAGAFGIGMLIDNSGNDTYKSEVQSQGFGFTRGWGALADFSGNDAYLSLSPYQDFLRYQDHFMSFTQGAGLGWRPIASGGYGFLVDGSGNDSYISDIYGQGTGYWYSLGALYDKSGDDRYQSWQYAQGSGVHLAFGILDDLSGDDVYISHGVSQGCGHDIAFGLLADEKGNDHYFAESLSLGGGNANAISILADVEGDDSYFAQNISNTFGYSDFRRSYGMIGAFIDGGGNDSYGSIANNNSILNKSTFGVFADIEINNTAKEATESSSPASAPDPVLAAGLDSLFVQASAASDKHQYMVQPARNRIIAMKSSALPFIAAKLSTASARERLALENILPALYDADSTSVRTFLIDSLQSNNYRTLYHVCYTLGKKKVTEALPRMHQLLSNADWRIRALAAWQIGEIGDQESVEVLLPLLADKHPYVRTRAAHSVGRLFPDDLLAKLKPALEDGCFIVRNNAVQGILHNKPFSADIPIKALKENFSPKAKLALTRLIPDSYIESDDLPLYRTALAAQPVPVREAAYRSIICSSNQFWKDDLVNCLQSEPDQNLIKLIKNNSTIIHNTPKEKPEYKKDAKKKKKK